MSILESLIAEDFGLQIDSENWARSKVHNSLTINRKQETFYWNSEGIVGNAFTYLIQVRKFTKSKAKEFLKYVPNYKDTFIIDVRNSTETLVYPKLIEVFASNMWDNDKNRTYWKDRGITDETLRRFQVGRYKEFYSIPVFEDGILKQFHLRKDNPKTIRHYYKDVGPLLFNSTVLRYTKKVYIVEGVTDTLAMQQMGLPAVGSTHGCDAFLKEWINYFIDIPEIYICYDNDSAGMFGSKLVANILGTYKCKIFNFWTSTIKGYDINDWLVDEKSPEDLVELIENESKYVFELESPKSNNTLYKKGDRK